jgi:hypothetical protein
MKSLFYIKLLPFCLLLVACSQSPSTVTTEELEPMDRLTIRGDNDYILSDNANTNKLDEETVQIEAGMLTAGQWNDLESWDFWQQLLQESSYQDFQEYWEMFPAQRYDVRLVDAVGKPAQDIKVQLADPIAGVLWEARTNYRGEASLWAQPFAATEEAIQGLELRVVHDKKTTRIGPAIPLAEGLTEWQLSPNVPTGAEQLEVLFVVDATGSMDDEINYLKEELHDVIEKYQLLKPDTKLRLGSIFYRDYTPKADYLTRTAALSEDYQATFDFINQQEANGGGDFAEAVEAALAEAVNEQEWSEQSATRLVFLLLDAPAHHNPKSLRQLKETLQTAAAKGIRIIPIASSGIDKETEFLMRFFSILSGGTYVFITDHSGVGKGHIEPTVGNYEVEYLNDLLLKLLQQYSSSSVNLTQ